MNDIKETVANLHDRGYNCAQSVVCAFQEIMDFDPAIALRMSEPLGFGMGQEYTCGAVTAMALVIGIADADGNMEHPCTEEKCFEIMRAATEEFRKRNHSLICSEIRQINGADESWSCAECVGDAVEIVSEVLKINECLQ